MQNDIQENIQENIIEIFSSIQGEGKYVGCRQIFVRFEGCNLACRYCDTENAPGKHQAANIETAAGSRTFRTAKNPMTVNEVAGEIHRLLLEAPHHSVSFTGGEPLLHAAFLHALREKVTADVPFFLETNGTLAQPLKQVLDDIAIISMDVKLPSILTEPVWQQHQAFLQLARQKDLYGKIVISAETTDEEFQEAVSLLAENAPEALLILQPVTPYGGVKACPPARVLSMQAAALQKLKDVRVIPQTHKMIGQL